MKDRILRALPVAGLLAATALVVVLAQQKRALISEVEQTRRQLRQAATEPIRGMYVPAFQATTLEGTPATIGEVQGEGRQVLLMYTTTCPYCLSSLPAWKQLAATADTLTGVQASVYGVSLDSAHVTRQYIDRHRLPYPTVRFPSVKMAGMYRAGSVPITLVLDEQGRTIYSRTGELKEPAAIDSVIAAIRWRPEPPAEEAPAQPATESTASSGT